MLLQYILKLSISLSVVYLFYQLLLRRLTFYTLNRWYLVVYSLLCFVIPFINVFTFFNKPSWRESAVIGYIPALEEFTKAPGQPAAASFNWMTITLAVIAIGMAGMMVRLLFQYYSLFKIRSKAVLLYNDNVKLYHIDKPVIPFSFGNAIFVNQHQHNEDELKEIIHHEFIHVKQRHSLDILWSELLCIVNWYNPFAWLLKKDIRQNLEFIADQQVLKTGLDRKQYQYLLLKVTGVYAFSITSNFNFSSLKKRIAMMNKTKSAKVNLIRFLFILPLLVVVLLAFRNTRQQQPPVLRTPVTDTVPVAAGGPPDVANLESITVNKDSNTNIIIMQWKNGLVERFDLKNPKDRETFKKEYGHELPEPTSIKPPKAPAPPTPPAPAPEIITGSDVNKILTFDITGNTATVTLKDGTIEKYDLKNSAEKKAFQNKYGDKPEQPEAPESAETPEAPAPAAAPVASADIAIDQSALAVSPKPTVSYSIKTKQVTNAQAVISAKVPANAVSVGPVAGVINIPSAPIAAVSDINKQYPSRLICIISKTSTEEQLKQLQKDLEAKGYKLELDNTTYVSGQLANIIANISNAEGKQGSFSATDFENIMIMETRYKNKKSTGFQILIKSDGNTAGRQIGHPGTR